LLSFGIELQSELMTHLHILMMLPILLLHGCSSGQKSPREFSQSKERPKWIFSPQKSCVDIKEVCVSGEGKSRQDAEADANKQLAQLLETKVSSETTVNTTSQSESVGVVVKGKVTEELNQQVKEVVDNVILQGVTFRERYEDGDYHYALGVMDSLRVGKSLEDKIDQLDEKMEAWLRTGKRRKFRALKAAYNLRGRLNQQLVVLKGRRAPKRITFDRILDLVYGKGKKGNKAADLLEGKISESLTEGQFKVSRDPKVESDLKVKGQVDVERQFLNVNGFVKYKVIVNLASYNQKGEKIGALYLENEQVGRSFRQAFERALGRIEHTLFKEDKISELDLIE
jgi:hypothetical protein